MRHKQIKKALNNAELVKVKHLSFSYIRFKNSIDNGTLSLKGESKTNFPKENMELYNFIENLNWDLTAFDDEVGKNFHSCKNENERIYCLNEYRAFLFKFTAIQVKFLDAIYSVFLSTVKKHFPFDDLTLIESSSKIKQLNAKRYKNSVPKEVFTTLAEAAVSNEAENAIYKILIDAGVIDNESKIFIDKTGGNKGSFYSTMILFFEKGYFKRKLNRIEYLNICNNTFKVIISESTGKNHKTRPKGLDSIPHFSKSH